MAAAGHRCEDEYGQDGELAARRPRGKGGPGYVSRRCLLIGFSGGALAAAAFLILLGLWSDARFVRSFQEREQNMVRATRSVAARPEPRPASF